MNNGISVIIPALNEEKSVAKAIADAEKIIKGLTCPYEIIVVDDGSTDATWDVVHRVSQTNHHVTLLTNERNKGLGYCLRKALSVAKMPHVTLYPSDNEMRPESFKNLVNLRKKADLISAYMANPEDRSVIRRIVSLCFVIFTNTVFGLSLRYYTGPFIAKTALLKKENLVSDGVTILAELRVRLIKRGATHIEIPFTFSMRKYGKATIFRWKTFQQAFVTVAALFRDQWFGRL